MRFAAAVVCVLCSALPGCTGGTPRRPLMGRATVTEVVDGDTIDVEIGGRTERVRLIGIDTPETKKPNAPIECYGPGGERLHRVRCSPSAPRCCIERDIVGRDDYGRLLGYVHLVDADGGATTFVNLEIVEQGYATPLTIEPNSTYARDFAAAARRAERADLGMWAACSSRSTRRFR